MERASILGKPVKTTFSAVHRPERCQDLEEWNHEATLKMAKNSGTKQHICD